jgi:signal transduction histidine kinase
MPGSKGYGMLFPSVMLFGILVAACILHLRSNAQSTVNFDKTWVGKSITRNTGIRKTADTLILPLDGFAGTRYLLVENPHLNRIILRDRSSGWMAESGDSLPFSNRPMAFRMFVFPVTADRSGDTMTLILEKKGENLSYTLRLLEEEEWERYLSNDFILAGFITGCYVLVMMISLVLLYFNRQLKFLFFNVYVLTSLGWFLNDTGLLFQWVWPEHPSWHNSSRGFFSSITMAFFGSYLYQNPGSRILRGVRKAMYFLTGIITIKIVSGILAANGVFPPALKPFFMHLNGMAVSSLFGYIAFSLLFNINKYKSDRFEIIGIVTYALFIFQLGLRELGLLPIGFSVFHHMEVILFFFVQIGCMALHLFMMEKKRRRNEAEHILAITRQQDHIISEKVIEMEEQEKKRIARNIHDEIGSLFVAMKYRILSLRHSHEKQQESLDQLMNICNEGIEKQYSVVDDMVFQRNSGQDLRQAVIEKFRQLFGHSDIAFHFSTPPDDQMITDIQKIQVYRIISELLTNTLKHSHANKINLRIDIDHELNISYQDDGPGFDPHSSTSGRGISNILNRVVFLQGKYRMLRTTESDWKFEIVIPLRHE